MDTLKRKLEATIGEIQSKKMKHNFCTLIDCTCCEKKLDKKKMGFCGKCSLFFCFDCLQECDDCEDIKCKDCFSRSMDCFRKPPNGLNFVIRNRCHVCEKLLCRECRVYCEQCSKYSNGGENIHNIDSELYEKAYCIECMKSIGGCPQDDEDPLWHHRIVKLVDNEDFTGVLTMKIPIKMDSPFY